MFSKISKWLYGTQTKSTTQHVNMERGSSYNIPESWQYSVQEAHHELNSPENDTKIYLIECPSNAELLEAIIHQAWCQIYPDFEYKPKQKIAAENQEGWEKSVTIIYETPTSESRMMIGAANLFQGQAHIILCNGSNAGFSRRSAEIMQIIGSWKPSNFQTPDLNNNEVKSWTEEDKNEFDAFVQHAMKELKVPGASIAIVHRDKGVIYQNCFGVKQIGMDEPVTLDTPFMIGSTTKPLTSLMMAMLVDRKQLQWDTPITSILPQFKLGDAATTRKLNLRHTVSASTGMPRRDAQFMFKQSRVTASARLAEMADMRPTTQFGEIFQYSNHLVMTGGFAAAKSYAPEETTEDAYNKAMKELVFRPLGMSSTVIKPDEALQLGAASPHTISFEGERCALPIQFESGIYSVAPAGGIWSTTSDLCRYLMLEMNKGLLDGKRVIDQDSLLERRKPGVAISKDVFYGLGLMCMKEQGLDVIGHGGATFGFSSECQFFPEKDLGIVILSNACGAVFFVNAVKQKFLELTFSSPVKANSIVQNGIDLHASTIQATRSKISISPSDMQWVEDLVGEYQSDTLGYLAIQKSDDGYEIIFEEWRSRLGCQIEKNGTKIITILDGPVPGFLKLQVSQGRLIFDDGQQTKYEFSRKLQKTMSHQENSCHWIKYGLFGAAAVGALVTGACVLYNQSIHSNGM